MIAVAGYAALATSCASLEPSASALPDGAVPMVAPAVYRDWQLSTEECSGLSRDFTKIQFYVVPDVNTFPTEDGPKVGLWTRVGHTNRIVIAGKFVQNEMVVRHEMLHELLGREGHPVEYFVTRCHLTWESWQAAGGN